MKKKLMCIILGCVILLLLPYAYVETLTRIYDEETAHLYKQTSMIDDDNYHKVLRYSANESDILYMTSEAQFRCNFIKENNEWKLESWVCVWSKQGSASGFVYPFYPLK